MFDALDAVGIETVPTTYDDESADAVGEELLSCGVVLVWVDPVAADGDRAVLDTMLRSLAARGTCVSTHPDVILAMGTKDVLYATRALGWGSDVDRYRSVEEFRCRFPERLVTGQATRVLKQTRGNGGIGVWKVERVDATTVTVQGAHGRGHTNETIPLEELLDRGSAYFGFWGGTGYLIDQPFQARIAEGLIRCYFVKGEVVGFCRQYADPAAPPERVFGLPSAKTMFPPTAPEFAPLRDAAEREWVPQLQTLVGIDDTHLPFLWDADFLYGPRDANGSDTYVLCEINVSSVLPYPQEAAHAVASALLSDFTGRA